MARTESTMLALGTTAPNFSLHDTVTQTNVTLSKLPSKKVTVIMFICNHCPFVIHLHKGLQQLVANYKQLDVSFMAISSNDATEYPQDAPDKMAELFTQLGFTFPYLYDETQTVAKAYNAACTPDFYVFDNHLSLVYRGQFDDSRPGSSVPVTGNHLRTAIDCLLQNKPVPPNQFPSLGCNIKWKQ